MTTYLLRLNLDVKESDFKNQLRFALAVSSIKSLSKRTNKIVVLSHLGRPRGIDKSLSLRRFAPALTAASGKKIKFISHFHFQKIKKEIDAASGGSVFLLENLRYLPGEAKNSKTLAKQLAGLGDRYINDDFATSHRADASIAGVTELIPSKPGSILRKEVQALTKIRTNPRHPFVVIIGGAKLADKIVFIKYLLPKADYVLVGGGPANNFLKLDGVNIGSSIYEPKLAETTKLLARSKKVIIPIDWKEERGKILDIGPKTIRLYSDIISNARTIIWNGPMGYFEDKKFATGTNRIARAILSNKRAKTVIGGAETTAALQPLATSYQLLTTRNKNLFLSTGGGAMLDFLAGKKLPGITALKRKG